MTTLADHKDMEDVTGATPQEPTWPRSTATGGSAGARLESGGVTLEVGTYGFTFPSQIRKDGRVFTGWIEDDAKTWIIFLGADKKPALYFPNRVEGGAVEGDPVILDDK